VALDGGPHIAKRAWDDAGKVQPTRAEFVAERGELKAPVRGCLPNQHFHGITVGPSTPRAR